MRILEKPELLVPALHIPPSVHGEQQSGSFCRAGFDISKLKGWYSELWHRIPACFPSFRQVYTPQEQCHNAAEAQKHLEQVEAEAQTWETSIDQQSPDVKRILLLVRLSFSHLFRMPELAAGADFLEEYFSCGVEFIRRVRKFDPLLPASELYQALRNVWIVNSLQTYTGKSATLTQSAFAYSLLYPYTDNCLDDPDISTEEKERFVVIVTKILEGESIVAPSPHTTKILRLLSMIEADYPRREYPDLYDSLLAIHRGQERSLFEQRTFPIKPATSELLDISIEKGGASVLTDAYIANGNPSGRMIEFAFGMGIALQLLDDLQDVQQDIRNHHHTIFTEDISPQQLEQTTNRLFNFIDHIYSSQDGLPLNEAGTIRALSLESCRLLAFEAIAHLQRRHCNSYIKQIEAHSPFNFRDLISLRERIEASYKRLEEGRGSYFTEPLSIILR